MKKFIITLACSSMALGAMAASDPASAQFRGLRDAVKKATGSDEAGEVAEEAAERATGSKRSSGQGIFSRGSRSATAETAVAKTVGGPGPVPSKFTSQLSCANLGIGNAFIGRDGKYTFSKGISTETRSGLLERRNVSPTNGCMFEGLSLRDVLYVEFDAGRYNKRDYKMQCVAYDGSEQLGNTNGPSIGGFAGRAIMLHTGNSTGYTPTASGSNRSRTTAYENHMKNRGRTYTTVAFPAAQGSKDFFCQMYNENTGKSAFGLTFRRSING